MQQKFLWISLAALMTLPACTGQDVKRSLGMKRNQPDAFQVVSRPPLSVPPEYHLRPPSDRPVGTVNADERGRALVVEGKELPARRQPDDSYYNRAETAVSDVDSAPLASGADAVFLQQAGADRAQTNIRTTLREENRQYQEVVAEKEDGLLEKLNPFPKDYGDPTVDAHKEAERLRAAKEEGKPLDEGEVPEIDPKKQGVF